MITIGWILKPNTMIIVILSVFNLKQLLFTTEASSKLEGCTWYAPVQIYTSYFG